MRKFVRILLAVFLIPLAIAAYYDLTHQRAAAAAVALVKQIDRFNRLSYYRDIYITDHEDMLVMGAGHSQFGEDYGVVDGNERSLRHYYEPTFGTGVPWFNYYFAWIADGAQVRPPILGFYDSALEWARNGADTRDVRNWEGAILAYDYSPSSRKEAYYRLGHVAHLIADMAQPDHATCTPHAASGFIWPEQANQIFPFFERIVKGVVDARTKLLEMLTNETRMGGRFAGFERFIEMQFKTGKAIDIPLPLGPGERPICFKQRNLDFYFNEMAGESNRAYQAGHFTLPIGLKFWPTGTAEADVAWALLSYYVKGTRKDYSFIPAIDLNDKYEKARYLDLGLKLLTHSAALNAGLLQFFYDTVAPPPYVKRVVIRQGGAVVYEAAWQDRFRTVSGNHVVADSQLKPYQYEVLESRDIATLQNAVLQAHQPAVIEIEFGPVVVGVSPSLRRLAVTVGTVPLSQGSLDRESKVFRCQFIPEWNPEQPVQPITIEAEAVHAPYDSQEGAHDLFSDNYSYRKGELDSRPDTPAKASPREPYTRKGFEPGPDRWHKVKVALLPSLQSDKWDERADDPDSFLPEECNTEIPLQVEHHNAKGTRMDYWTYKNSQTRVGPYKEWFDTQRTRIYKTGCYDARGRKTGVWTNRRRDGRHLNYQYTYREGKRHGRFKRWHPNGLVLDYGYYYEGKRDGDYRSFHDNGRPFSVGKFARGEYVGEWVEYDKHTGKVKKVKHYNK